MAETVRERILIDINTELNKISVAEGYRTDFASVVRWDMRGNDLVDLPAIVISAGEDDWDDMQHPVMRCDMAVFLDVFIQQAESDARATDKIINDIIADIFQCLWKDPSRGGNAILTQFKGVAPFEAVEGNPMAGCIIELNIKYQFSQSDPEALI